MPSGNPEFPSIVALVFQKISQKLSDLVNYVQAVGFHSFEHSRDDGKFFHMSSFGESKAEEFFQDPKVLFLMKTFLQTHPPITKTQRVFHSLFAQHVSTLNWILYR
jgi:hypothetical protein